MYGTTVAGLENTAQTDGCSSPRTSRTTRPTSCSSTSAQRRSLPSGDYGAIDFSNTTFTNASILLALEKAADGYHNCHVKGGVIIEYGNSNYHMSNAGMINADAWNAGYDQECRQPRTWRTIRSTTGTRARAPARRATWSRATTEQLITKQLVNGASAQGWAIYDDFGSVDGCPTSGSSNGPCNNGWDVSDVGYVSFHGLALPLPEIYYAVSAEPVDRRSQVVERQHHRRLLLRRRDRRDAGRGRRRQRDREAGTSSTRRTPASSTPTSSATAPAADRKGEALMRTRT